MFLAGKPEKYYYLIKIFSEYCNIVKCNFAAFIKFFSLIYLMGFIELIKFTLT